MALVSIIVPVYNTCRYLAECIDSLIAISTKRAEIEIILIDDGSTDGSGEMCDGYALKDSRIRVIHQENQGVSAARNAGLDVAQGEYLMFVDSDDYVHPKIISHLFGLMQKHGADMASGGYYEVDENGREKKYSRPELSGVMCTPTFFEKLPGHPITLWKALYKKDVWDDLHFSVDMVFCEDVTAVLDYLVKSRVIVVDAFPVYYYRQRSGSAIYTLDVMKFHDCMKWIKYMGTIALKHGDSPNKRSALVVMLLGLLTTWYERGYCLMPNDMRAAKSVGMFFCPHTITGLNAKALFALGIICAPHFLTAPFLLLFGLYVDTKRSFLKGAQAWRRFRIWKSGI